jgi:hypothetical protein
VFGIIRIYGSICKNVQMVVRFVLRFCSNHFKIFFKSLQFDLNNQTQWEFMFTYLHETNTDTILDEEEEEKVGRNRPLITLSNKIDWFEKMSKNH